MKTQEQIIKDYHKKLAEIKIRIPSEESCGINYLSKIRQRAADLGFTSKRGEGSINAYVISLIEQDMGIEIKSITDLR